jgi:hypothetical protein
MQLSAGMESQASCGVRLRQKCRDGESLEFMELRRQD